MKDQYVSIDHILLALCELKDGDAATIFRRYGIGREAMLKVLMDIRGSQRVRHVVL